MDSNGWGRGGEVVGAIFRIFVRKKLYFKWAL